METKGSQASFYWKGINEYRRHNVFKQQSSRAHLQQFIDCVRNMHIRIPQTSLYYGPVTSSIPWSLPKGWVIQKGTQILHFSSLGKTHYLPTVSLQGSQIQTPLETCPGQLCTLLLSLIKKDFCEDFQKKNPMLFIRKKCFLCSLHLLELRGRKLTPLRQNEEKFKNNSLLLSRSSKLKIFMNF